MISKSRFLKAAFTVFAILAITCGWRARRIDMAFYGIAAYGGSVSDDFLLTWIFGPNGVSFRSEKYPLQDSDAVAIGSFLSAFPDLHTLDFMNTDIGDVFIRNISRRGLAKKINLSGTKCTEESVIYLSESQACEIIRVSDMAISRETLSIANRNDIEIVQVERFDFDR